MTLICGIDEAGRGPVLGPLVIVGVVIAEEKIGKLEEVGVKDSKLLSVAKREELYDKVLEIVDSYEMFVIGPDLIDQYVTSQDDDKNLNWLEADHAAAVIDKLQPTRAIIDCPSTNVTAFAHFVREKLQHKEVQLICEHKADMNYVVVGAASILAKVTRDRKIEELKKEIGVDFGSLPYSEKVLVKHNGSTKLMQIGEIVEQGKDNIKVFSMNPKTNKIKEYEITNFIEHPKTKIFRLCLNKGKYVDLSDNHPLFVLDDNGEIVQKELRFLEKGEFVCVAGNIASNGKLQEISSLEYLKGLSSFHSPIIIESKNVQKVFKKNTRKTIQEKLIASGYPRTSYYYYKSKSALPLPIFLDIVSDKDYAFKDCCLRSNKGKTRIPTRISLDKDFLWFLGMYVAEGSLSRDKVIISTTNPYVYKKIKNKIARRFNIPIYWSHGDIGLCSIILTKIIMGMGLGENARQKSVPEFVFSCSKGLIHSFLEGLYEGDGYDRDGSWEIEIYSEKLAQQIQWLNLFLGRVTSYKRRKNREGRIVNILAKDTNSLSPDNIPSIIGPLLKKLRIKKNIGLREMGKLTKINPSHVLRIEKSKVMSIQKKSLRKIARALSNPPILIKLLGSDLCWLRVMRIKYLNKKEKVYDLEVRPKGKKIENFLGGNCGIILHNSGYPSDPKTQDFLRTHWDKAPFFRKSWSSWQKMKEGKMQKKLGEW